MKGALEEYNQTFPERRVSLDMLILKGNEDGMLNRQAPVGRPASAGAFVDFPNV